MIQDNVYSWDHTYPHAILINGTIIASGWSGSTDISADQVQYTTIWPVEKGDIITYSALGYGYTWINYMPCR